MLPVKLILCPTDFSEPSRSGVKAATELAAHFGAEICLVYVVPIIPALPSDPEFAHELVPEYEELLESAGKKNLSQLQQQIAADGIRVRMVVANGQPADEIAQIAEREHADLIVISTHGASGWRHLVFGSVAEKVVRFAKCPVLTVRAPAPQG